MAGQFSAPRRTHHQQSERDKNPILRQYDFMGRELSAVFSLCGDDYQGVPAKVWSLCDELVNLDGLEAMVRKKCEELLDSVTFDHYTDESEMYSDNWGDEEEGADSGMFGQYDPGYYGGHSHFGDVLVEDDEEEMEVW
jgi:hypothetical protein